MTRDIEPSDPRQSEVTRASVRRDPLRGGLSPRPSRDRSTVEERGYIYQVSPDELETLREIGRFRTVALGDLLHHRYGGNAGDLREDLRSLQNQGLLQKRAVWLGNQGKKLTVVVLTPQGKSLAERQAHAKAEQRFYKGFVKPGEVGHDAAIYRMYQAEAARLAQQGSRIRRVVLDYELKQRVYSPLAKARVHGPLAYAKKQMEVARANGLTVIDGKIPLPDLRIEYNTASGGARACGSGTGHRTLSSRRAPGEGSGGFQDVCRRWFRSASQPCPR
jgi:hypothetical protein